VDTAAPQSPVTALACLEMVARHHGVDLSAERLAHAYAVDGEPDGALLLRIARENGFKARATRLDWPDLAGLGGAYPLILRLSNGNSVVLAGFRDNPALPDGGEAVIVDPLSMPPAFVPLSRARLETQWRGEALLLKRQWALHDERQPFGLRWFLPELLRQRGAFVHVVVAGLLLHLIALVTPLFFQVVIDKVLVHNSADTLMVLGIGVSVAVAFESLIGFLRNTLLVYVTNKLDIRLSTRIFDHLVRLPMGFFETSPAGVLAKHMQQIEKVREFFTGRLLTTVLDSWALLVFLPVLMAYSLSMSAIVLGFSTLVAVVVAAVMPWFRVELRRLYAAEGDRQALLVESLHGAATIKALALEPVFGRNWADASARAVTMQRRVSRVSLSAQALVGLLEKLLTVAIVWVGATKVFDGSLTVGELVAIQMLAGRVTGPLVQIVSLVNEFQQVALSVRMLGEIMNRPTEASSGALHPTLTGGFAFEGVTFTYPGASTPALDSVSLQVPAGAFVGVVGRSGSGKTTLLRLLQGMQRPSAGRVLFDGIDLREIDLAWLRRSLGVVLQESFVFKDSVRNNIAIAAPGIAPYAVIEAARLAGADEFIQRLPQGYDTLLEENAANLSGGQKQRLSIARALLTRPPILVFDEATSALDPESEAIVHRNMAAIASDRTVVAVSHRLSTLVGADLIVVLDQGRVVDAGPHLRLLRDCPLYRQLWDQQGAIRQSAHDPGVVAS
jgi:ATP-binding cassette subfamily B protein